MNYAMFDDVLIAGRRTPGDQSPGYRRPPVATTPDESGWQGGRP